uniref:Uncharacterized protein n=1 Tax=Ciona savignyi TaxID=51511 RepID=H2ZB17_CIOSA
KHKRKFSSFFKSLVIELDKDLYGPDNHLVEWHRTASTQETDGFQVKRQGDKNVRCTMLFMAELHSTAVQAGTIVLHVCLVSTLSRDQ